MAAYVEGDEAAFRQLFERYAPRLMRSLWSTTGSAEVARDLTQQTFLQLHRARRDFRPGAALRPWLVTIANNLRRDHLRARGRRQELELDPERQVSPDATPAASLGARQAAARVRQAVGRLPANQREVIELHWFAELSFAEIATALGIGRNAAKVRAHRGYLRLRQLLGSIDGGPAAAEES